ncbi:hypothetical protein BKA80DRAFT_254803 [Phyllosticta citrichinensis]
MKMNNCDKCLTSDVGDSSLPARDLAKNLLAASDPFSHDDRSAKAPEASKHESEQDVPMEETQSGDERSSTTIKMEDVDESSDVGAGIPMHQDSPKPKIKMEEEDEPLNLENIPMFDGDGDATVSRTEFNQLKDQLERLDAKVQMLTDHIRSI